MYVCIMLQLLNLAWLYFQTVLQKSDVKFFREIYRTQHDIFPSISIPDPARLIRVTHLTSVGFRNGITSLWNRTVYSDLSALYRSGMWDVVFRKRLGLKKYFFRHLMVNLRSLYSIVANSTMNDEVMEFFIFEPKSLIFRSGLE